MLFVGVTGGSGSGKTEVAKNIEKKYGARCLSISMDRFYKGGDKDTNFDVPDAIDSELAISVIRDLKAGKKVDLPNYDFGTHSRTDKIDSINPADYDSFVIESILVLSFPEIAKEVNVPVYVEADEFRCFIRRQRRDVLERNRDWQDVSRQYEATVHDAFVQYTKPMMQLPGILIVTNNGKIEDIQMQPIFSAIDRANKLAARFRNDSASHRLLVTEGHFAPGTSPTPPRKHSVELEQKRRLSG